MSESQGNNTLNQASSNMPNLGAAPNTNPGVGQAATGASMPQMASSTQSSPQSTAQPQQPTVVQPQSNLVAAQPIQAVPTASAQNPAEATQSAAKQPAGAVPAQSAQPQPRPTGHQVDYFAEQNARNAEKKAKNSKIIKIAAIIGAVVVLAVVGVVLWLSLGSGPNKNKNDVAETSTKDSTANILEEARELYGANGGVNFSSSIDENANNATEEYFNQALVEAGNNNQVKNQIRLAQLLFYFNQGSGDCNMMFEYENEINPEDLQPGDRSTLYNIYSLCYQQAGDMEKANHYNFLGYKLAVEIENAALEEANND